MRTSLIALIVAITTISCSTYKAPQKKNIETSRSYTQDYDAVWNKVVDWFSMNNTPIKNLDKSSGLISTEYNLMNNVSQSCDCGKAGFGQRFEDAKANFNVLVRRDGDSAVTVRVTTFFNVTMITASYTAGVPESRTQIECHSTGTLEKGILDHVAR